MVNYCAYCGTKLEPEYKFCPGCDAEIRADEAKRMAPMTGQPVPVATGNIPIATGSPLFDGRHGLLFVNWAFPNLSDAQLFDQTGRLIGTIARALSEYGVDYTISDTQQESIKIVQYNETHYQLLHSSGKMIADVEKRKVKETVEVHSIPEVIDYMSETEDFVMKKSIYRKSEDDEVAQIYKIRENEIPPNFTRKNTYTLRMKATDIDLRKVIPLMIINLMLLRSYPYR